MRGGRGARKRTAPERAAPEHESFDEDMLREVRALFSKVKGYSRPEGVEWRLPDPGVLLTEPPHAHPHLQALKRSLNTVKNQLSDKDLETWHQHTCSTNRAGTVTAHLRTTANAELCTQAWAKFYEVLGTFDLLPAEALQRGELLSVHLCEAPGAFISALNHFLKSSGMPCDWSWTASTLNPYYEANGRTHTIADDRLLARTLPWWFFGSDNTGDIMRQEHLLELQALVRRGGAGGVHLVTADGSFDCQEDPGEQEAAVAPLQLCEAVCALMILAPGGCLVLKMFTLLEHSSVSLLYLLACSFRTVRVFKPATSKPGNSELYLVCVGFQAPEQLRPLLAKLVRLYGPDMTRRGAVGLFPVHCIPESFLRQHEEVCVFFHDLQVATIKENLELFGRMGSEVKDRLERVRASTALYYTQHFQVRPLMRKSWLTRGVSVSGISALGGVWLRLWGGQQRQQRGSFNERQQQRTHTWRQHLTHTPFHQWVEGHCSHADGLDVTLGGPAEAYDLHAWYLLVGKALPEVRSSPFCEPGLLGLLNQALAESRGQEVKVHGVTAELKEVPVCFGCVTTSPHSVLAEVCSLPDVTSCLVLGEQSWWGVSLSLGGVSSSVEFSPDPCPTPWIKPHPLLHDGESTYQLDLLRSVLAALPRLPQGGALVVPLRSALTRVTAGVVLALHLCFRSLAFRCPSPGPPVALVCVGYASTPPRLRAQLEEALAEMQKLKGGVTQVLQIAPMEELLRGDLPHFLCCLNAAVARQHLHLLLDNGS
ncbi:cap-specific mRNA (nucleoside-2'-O-)-methyltransferase 2 [Clupea harengus]|uniref:Cap-specific mRNA (nucleoside-2'-O-)-methyltransferase 2 n=1 Tax=Clupea harengus TaxID=7950 RepID=A0A6P3W7Z6_CLUHA|nr:cap-specific mRNA (nucleoside-2'-O-)-methyltransferase 2 [Clupea harengus]